MNTISLPYLDNTSKLNKLAALSNREAFVLLDSAGSELSYNRFDIVSSDPTISLKFKNDSLKLQTAWDTPELTVNSTNPFQLMRILLKQFKPKNNQLAQTKKLPFCGGWLGYISYDIGRYLEKLPDNTDDSIDLPWINMGLYQWCLITDHKKQTTTLYNFGLKEKHWKPLSCQIIDALNNNHSSQPFDIKSNWQSNTNAEEYAKAFNQVKDYIYAGDAYQVNYAQQFSANYLGNEFSAYQKLSTINQAPFSAFINGGDHKILSLSPERFIECHDKKVSTQPIKGTRPRDDDPIKDKALGEALVNSEKDRAENLMIVDLLRNDLSRTADKASVKVTELFGHYRFQSVHHLISTIESKLKPEFDCFDLLTTTLPGGSITGAPKIRAMEIIEQLEKVKRNLYCGIIGYIDFNGNMDTNICIRTITAKNNQLFCSAGGGLVADSKLEDEYQETFDKLGKILPYLQPHSAL